MKVQILVDDDDFETLSQHGWFITKNGYAARTRWNKGKNEREYMHRTIMGIQEGLDIDHIDMNRINNQRSNLRHVTRSFNMANQKLGRGISKYKGVSYMKRVDKWIAYLRLDYKQYHLGYFDTAKEAAEAYNVKALEVFGDSSRLNKL